METVTKCEICGSEEKEFLYGYGAPDKIKVSNYICKDCGVVFQSPRMTLSELSEYYKKYSRDTQTFEIIGPWFEKFLSQIAGLRFDFLKKYLRPHQSIVEVGCGPGCLLSLIQEHEPTITCLGINPEESYAEFGRQRYGLNVEAKMFEEVDLPESRFDIFIFDHVFEHINKPKETLKRVYNHLKQDGYLFICTNNVLTPHGFLWQNFFLEHPFTYSPNTIECLLRECNFELKEIDTKGHVTYEGYHYPYMTLLAQKKDMLRDKNKGDNYHDVKERLIHYNKIYCLNNFFHTITYNLRIYIKKLAGDFPANLFYFIMTRPIPDKFRPKLFNHTLPPKRIN